MSKKLPINFSAIDWKYINWYSVRDYTSRLQYRIYISAFQQKYKKMEWLQRKLLSSPYARLLSVLIVYQCYTSFQKRKLNLSDKQKLSLAKHINLKNNSLHLLKIANIKNTKQYKIELIFIKQVQQILAELIIKPEYSGKSRKILYKYILNDFNIRNKLVKIIRTAQTKYYTEMLTLDFAMYITHGNYLVIMKKLFKPQSSYLQQYIRTWLQKENLLAFKTRKHFSNSLSSFVALKKTSLPVFVILALFVDELILSLACNNLHLKVKIFLQNSQLIFLYNNSYTYKYLLKFIRIWLLMTSIDFRLIQIHSSNINTGLHFLGFKLKIHQYLVVTMLKKSQILLWKELSQIIQQSKSSSIDQLIKRLSPSIAFWGSYFACAKCSKLFSYLDYLLYLKIWFWLRRLYPSTSKNKILQTYFVQNKLYFFYNKQLIKSAGILYTQQKITLNQYFLVKFMWMKHLIK